MLNALNTKGMPRLKIPPVVKPEKVDEVFTEAGYLTDEAYNKMKVEASNYGSNKERKKSPEFNFTTKVAKR